MCYYIYKRTTNKLVRKTTDFCILRLYSNSEYQVVIG